MSTGDGERAVDESWAEEPLCSKKPCCRDEGIAGKTADVVSLFVGGWWVCGEL